MARARQVKLPLAAEPRPAASLPAGIQVVRAGVLEVEFASGEELLGRLYELVRMAGEDLEQFECLLVLTCINQSKGAWVSLGEQLPWSIRTALPCRCRP